MKDLAKNIVWICQYIIDHPSNLHVTTDVDYSEATEDASDNIEMGNPAHNIVYRNRWSDLYANLNDHIVIESYKTSKLCRMTQPSTQQVLLVLRRQREIIHDDQRWYSITVEPGDIDITLRTDSAISQMLSPSDTDRRSWLLILWADCFIERVRSWGMGDEYSLLQATQQELRTLLEWLQKLV